MSRILIDCDPGLDDAVALLAACQSPLLDVVAITTVAGNVSGAQTEHNGRIVRTLAKREDIPVHAGAPGPLLRDAVTAEDFHGTTGLGGIDVPKPSARASRTHAVNAIISQCRRAKLQPLTLIMTGPMTNVALALTMAPDIKDSIKELVLMGGADSEGGNITPFAEFNVFADPHAAAIIFGSGLSIRCLSLDVTHMIRSTQDRIDRIRSIGSQQAVYAALFLEASCKLEFAANGNRAAPLHDPSTILALAYPELFEGRRADVSVVMEAGKAFGKTVPHFAADGAVLWYDQADVEAVFEALCRMLEGRS